MDDRKRLLLQRYQQDIIKDLEVEFILDDLYTKNVVDTNVFEEIFKKSNRNDCARFLIDSILQYGDNNTYEAFVDSLAKDYNWLCKRLTVDNNEPMFNESFEDSLSRGDVPRPPEHYVKRNAVEAEVASKLSQLSRHHILVLYGMSGSGKTSVAINVLRENSELITNNFNGFVFWLNLSNCKTQEDIIAHQNKLYRKTLSIYTRNSHMNSTMSMTSFGSNLDMQSTSSFEGTWKDLKDKLKTQFLVNTALKDALLVLDEVNERMCMEAFDIGCKILVTTRDSDVVANFKPEIIEIENSLKEEETLKILASYMDLDVSQLPRQARKFHDACKGSPFNIALIAAHLAENKERLLHDTSQWKKYLNKLDKKEFLNLLRRDDNPMKPIEVCINSLPRELSRIFKMLAILPDNVKVSSKVISKLWNKDVVEVENIMRKLRTKSLITVAYDQDQKNYLYEVHDLIMNYLRTSVTEEEKRKIHSDFLTSYHYDTNQLPINIVDDGYIAFYIGYHILHTKDWNNRWKLFNKLYLDLKFLGHKVRLTGPSDVILDLQKYELYIVDDDLDRELLINIRLYLITHGIDLYRYQTTDIIQSILQHESKGILYTKAMDIAEKRCKKNELYFEFLHEEDVEEIKHSTIDVKETITAVCFLGDYVVVGTVKGVIKMFHIPTNKLKKELSGTGASIKWVGACVIRPVQVAGLSLDGYIKLWHVEDIEQEESEDIIEEESEELYNNNFPVNCTITPKLGAFINCRWAENQKILITHTSRNIILYGFDGKVIDNFNMEDEILCCIPCNNDRCLVAALLSAGKCSLVLINLKSKEMKPFDKTDPVLDILSVPGSNRVISLKPHEITVHVYKSNDQQIYKEVLTSEHIRDNVSFLAMAVNKTGTLLFVSTDDSRIICVNLKTKKRVLDLENRRGNVISMDVSEIAVSEFEPGSDVLLTGTGTIESCAKVWNLDASYMLKTIQKNSKVRLTEKFDVSFLNAHSPHTPLSSGLKPHSASNTPQRHQSFANHTDPPPKRPIRVSSLSLDRPCLKPLNLKGICNNNDGTSQPLLAVVDDQSNIQILRGRKVITEVITQPNEEITAIKISPCNQYIVYGMRSGSVKKYTIRSKETKVIMDMYKKTVTYLKFVNQYFLIAGTNDCCIMSYRLNADGVWETDMMQCGTTHLGSQEILNDIQGKKKMGGLPEKLSSTGSEASLTSREHVFSNGESQKTRRDNTGLIDCFYVRDVGLITVENNAVVKLWNEDMKLLIVLAARQLDVNITCACFQKNILVMCDNFQTTFQVFELKSGDIVELNFVAECRLDSSIASCALSADGLILAVGLSAGDVVIWNVPGKRHLTLLKHHKSSVQSCAFSPAPDRLSRSIPASSPSPSPFAQPSLQRSGDNDSPPLVLVTMASEIVTWNISYLLEKRANKSYWRTGRNVVTPIASPMDNKNELTEAANDNGSSNNNFFFGSHNVNDQDCWRMIWKAKKCKEGSKRQEILSCIKLSGMNAKKICHDKQFSCFVTVDNSGHVHIMNVMQIHAT